MMPAASESIESALQTVQLMKLDLLATPCY
jgi:hypothetical protein